MLQPVVMDADNLKLSVMALHLIRFISHPKTEALRLLSKSAFGSGIYGHLSIGGGGRVGIGLHYDEILHFKSFHFRFVEVIMYDIAVWTLLHVPLLLRNFARVLTKAGDNTALNTSPPPTTFLFNHLSFTSTRLWPRQHGQNTDYVGIILASVKGKQKTVNTMVV